MSDEKYPEVQYAEGIEEKAARLERALKAVRTYLPERPSETDILMARHIVAAALGEELVTA